MHYYWINDDVRTFMARGYLRNNQTIEDRISEIAENAERILNKTGFANKFMEYMSKGYYSLSTPVWVNFGKDSGLPISCFGSYVEDSMDGIFSTLHEVALMSKYGGGTSSYWGDVRGRGAPITNNGFSEGAVNFMRVYDTGVDVSKQGMSRRGVHAAYLPIDHPDIEEFLQIKSEGNPIQKLFNGVCVPSEWLQSMKDGDIEKRRIWAKVLQARSRHGTPYIFFTDNVNDNAPDAYRKKDRILASNVCSEITLPQTVDESFVCCLSSLNLEKYDEWKDKPDVVFTLVDFLDAVMTEFIEKGKHITGLERAVKFAYEHRALGIGVVGYFSYLQKNMIPFESTEARDKNVEIFKFIDTNAKLASTSMAVIYGKAPKAGNTLLRHTTLTAVAPTTSSSFILGGVSQSIEPPKSNYFVRDLDKIKVTEKNKYLKRELSKLGMDTEAVWQSIRDNDGSVQHLDLPTPVKDVFKTFSEVSQYEIIVQAAERQRYIDQSQSLNLMVHPKTPVKDINKLILDAHDMGIKTLYYQHSMNDAQLFRKELLNCTACEA